MNPERGSASLVCLAVCLLILSSVYLLAAAVTKDYLLAVKDMRGYQLRAACASAIASTPEVQAACQERILYQGYLYPGGIPFQVSKSNEYSGNGSFSMLSITASCGSAFSQKLSRLTMHPDKEGYMPDPLRCLISSKIEGAEYAEGKIYTGTGKVNIPSAAFLEGRCISSLTSEELQSNGFTGDFYYLYSFDFGSGRSFPGTGALVAHSSINVGSGCRFSDRIILMSERGGITIGSGSVLDCALIMAGGTVTIESGCRIQGVICSGTRIVLRGPSVFIPDENAVAPFSSAVSIT